MNNKSNRRADVLPIDVDDWTSGDITSVVVIWKGSVCHSPDDLSTYEQTHHFAHTNVKSAKRTTVARVRRWHGDINVVAVLVNPDESTLQQARQEAPSIPTVRLYVD